MIDRPIASMAFPHVEQGGCNTRYEVRECVLVVIVDPLCADLCAKAAQKNRTGANSAAMD